jgi:hypothetical protein
VAVKLKRIENPLFKGVEAESSLSSCLHPVEIFLLLSERELGEESW